MERLERPANRSLPKVRVYIDDLHGAAEILKEEDLVFGDISVALDSHPHRLKTLDNEEVEELKRVLRTKRLHSLQITASPSREKPASTTALQDVPNIVIDLGRDHASLTSTRDTVHGLGLLDKLEEHFNHCKRNDWAIWAIGPLAYLLLVAVLLFDPFGFMASALRDWGGAIVILLPLVAFAAAAFVARLIPHSTIVLAKKADAPSWWERKREDLLWEVLRAGIAGVVGALIGFFIGSSQ